MKRKSELSARYDQLIKGLHFSSGLSPEKKEIILNDLKFLSLERFDQSTVDAQFRKVADMPDTSTDSLLKWLQERLHVIVEDSFDQNSNLSSAGPTDSNILPFSNPTESLAAPYLFFHSKGNSSKKVDIKEDMQIVMSNLGTEIYVAYKDTSILPKLNVPGVGKIVINTPRVGIVREGPGFFSPLTFGGVGNPQEIHYIIFRLATDWHEAAHDDGRGNFLGRQHVKCPAGHKYYRANDSSLACDWAINGSYMIGALLIKSYLDSCSYCRENVKGALKLIYEDQISRVLIQDPLEALKVENHPRFLDATPDWIK